MNLTFAELQRANKERAHYWTKDCTGAKPGLEFAVIELGGEVGELQNEIKKFIRHQLGMPGGKDDPVAREDELADVVICASLLANKLDIDLGAAVARKFNKTSRKHKMPVELGEGFFGYETQYRMYPPYPAPDAVLPQTNAVAKFEPVTDQQLAEKSPMHEYEQRFIAGQDVSRFPFEDDRQRINDLIAEGRELPMDDDGCHFGGH